MMREKSDTVYIRDKSKVELSDFILKAVIGQGSFGKVFLVQLKIQKKIFAMKTIRKDVVLEFD